MEEPEGGPGLSAVTVTILAIILVLAVYLLYRYITA